MNLRADVVGDEPDDALAVRRGELEARVLKAAGEPVDSEPAVGVEHDLADAGVVEPIGDRRPERRAQHPRATGLSFGPKGDGGYLASLRPTGAPRRGSLTGWIQRGQSGPAQQGS
jgi:hypothetical protein